MEPDFSLLVGSKEPDFFFSSPPCSVFVPFFITTYFSPFLVFVPTKGDSFPFLLCLFFIPQFVPFFKRKTHEQFLVNLGLHTFFYMLSSSKHTPAYEKSEIE
ncbi:hypothetical protein HanIR_Chr05g0242631 [Helianthus annuus]|nr:hypothetical protein HanIR_Chr05g0242631 [Helianthus annuus]